MNDIKEVETLSSADSERVTPLKRFLPLALLFGAAGAIYTFELQTYLSFEALSSNREFLSRLVEQHLLAAVLIFIAVYAVATAISLPGGALLSVTGGFLFGGWQGAMIVVIAATIGATVVFLIARTALGDSLRERAGPWLRKMEQGFQDNALSYLLTLRLIPIFPFFVVNLVPAFLGVRLSTYVLATGIGRGCLPVEDVAGTGNRGP